ncbi:hypothetical protein ABB37_02151 [Leptomonas pyrrhocoris]|uniref:Uncharacterized protein n=1 Tax=Leptomonas pyrrhocoris TaxID=157538 RepID=A0A0N0DYD5_LEPPY|nr:hypothetical protein ABB37_02151 [Leptomonas pyrrhocoris]KPA84015.1 hypothetical protein ABB37_02151 [Leptomonas pyrrhocoris]|eukprot:XP_015662454.1 hypothetical protein ABB37_02151 [Leptomonas pyrrhocoris]
MGLGIGCLYACAPFTLIASILLFMMAVMLRDGNWTFEVLAAKHGWDRSAKSKACRNGGIIYICISAVLWCFVLLDSFLIQLEKLPSVVSTLWRQRRLPSWRELRHSSRKRSAKSAHPAADVVVASLSPHPPAQSTQTLTPSPPQQKQNQTDAQQYALPPATASAITALSTSPSLPVSAARESLAAAPPYVSSPLTAQVYEGSRGGTTMSPAEHARRAVSPSENTSATASVREADHLLG